MNVLLRVILKGLKHILKVFVSIDYVLVLILNIILEILMDKQFI